MAEQITSDVPEAAQFESMSEQEIETQLKSNEVEVETGVEQKAEAKPEVKESGLSETTAPNPLEEKVAALEKLLNRVSKESGQGRALQSKIAQLEKKLSEQQTQQLTPEQAQQNKEADAYIKAFIDRTYGDVIGAAENARFNQEYRGSVAQMLDAMGVPLDESNNKILGSIIAKEYEAAKNGDEMAQARLDVFLDPKSGPATLVAFGLREISNRAQVEAQKFQSGRLEAGKKAGQTIKGSAAPAASTKKSLGDMTQADLDKMDEKELAALVDANS